MFTLINHFSKDFFAAWEIYRTSLPSYQIRSYEDFIKTLENPLCRLWITMKEDKVQGMAVIWNLPGMDFLEQFAVAKEWRGQSVGSSFLKKYLSISNKRMLAEIDQKEADILPKRISFYKKLGFHVNPQEYHFPGYRAVEEKYPCYLISYPSALSDYEFHECRTLIYENVYPSKLTFSVPKMLSRML